MTIKQWWTRLLGRPSTSVPNRALDESVAAERRLDQSRSRVEGEYRRFTPHSGM